MSIGEARISAQREALYARKKKMNPFEQLFHGATTPAGNPGANIQAFQRNAMGKTRFLFDIGGMNQFGPADRGSFWEGILTLIANDELDNFWKILFY